MNDLKSQNRKKSRRIGYLNTIEHRYYIFCEGEQTEPNYFRGFEKTIKENPIYKNALYIETIGVGAETLRVINHAEEYVIKNSIDNAKIWCVYDKDSFPSQNFNAVSEKAKHLNVSQTKATYCVAWSNQCIEYWFILHFDWYDSDNDRKYYRKYLHGKFAELGWKRYEKNNEDLFYILTDFGNPKLAIKHANNRLAQCSGLTDADSSPATKVHLLVEELAKYLPEQLQKKYI